jgi:uncharacterized protein YndB with AHSA1/START domain
MPVVSDEEAGPRVGNALQRWVRMRRRLGAAPERVFRAWADPEELARWFPEQVEGGLAVGLRSMLVWPERRVWWDVIEANPSRSFVFRWPWLPDDTLVTTVKVAIEPVGYGSRLALEDGPFPIERPGTLDAWAKSIEGWSEALAMLRAHLDFSVDLRWRQ